MIAVLYEYGEVLLFLDQGLHYAGVVNILLYIFHDVLPSMLVDRKKNWQEGTMCHRHAHVFYDI